MRNCQILDTCTAGREFCLSPPPKRVPRQTRRNSWGIAGRERHLPAAGMRMVSSTVGRSAATAAIAPPCGSDCISRPRAATSLTALSTLRTPATHAAAYSPMLWPTRIAGSMPQPRHSSDNAYSRQTARAERNRFR